MRILIQVARGAKVEINHTIVAQIDYGYLLFCGFTAGDDQPLVDKMITKLLGLRIFPDAQGATNLSIQSVGGQILSVPQFTLYADTTKGRRPSFISALSPSESSKLFSYFNQQLALTFGPIQTGVFGADMLVSLTNQGPFTIMLDSKELFHD